MQHLRNREGVPLQRDYAPSASEDRDTPATDEEAARHADRRRLRFVVGEQRRQLLAGCRGEKVDHR